MTGGSINRRNVGIIGRSRNKRSKESVTHLVTDMKHGVTQREACLKEYNSWQMP